MALEQQLLEPVTDLQSRGQDEITWLPGLHEAFPPEGTSNRFSYLLALDLVGLQADPHFEVLEKGLLCPVIHNLLVIISGVTEPSFGMSPAIGDGCPWSPQQMTWTP